MAEKLSISLDQGVFADLYAQAPPEQDDTEGPAPQETVGEQLLEIDIRAPAGLGVVALAEVMDSKEAIATIEQQLATNGLALSLQRV